MAQPFTLLPATGAEQVDEWIRLGTEAQMAGNMPKAQQFYNSALRLCPNHAIASHNLAVLLACSGHINDALLAMERATLFDGVEPVIAANQALLCLEADRIDEGLDAAKRAVALAPNPPADPAADPLKTAGYMASRLALAMVSATAGHPDDSLKHYNDILAVEPKHPAASPNSCFVTSLMAIGPKEGLEQRQRWYQTNKSPRPHWPLKRDKSPMTETCPECKGIPDVVSDGDFGVKKDCPTCHGKGTIGRPLRVGYVGGDFKSHSAAMMFSNVLLNHDPKNVEQFLYCSLPTNPKRDDMSQMFLRKVADGDIDFEQFGEDERGQPKPWPVEKIGRWRNIVGKTDDEVEHIIDADQLDIMVDLAGHTNGGRLGVFCRKLAPIQIAAWGFAHGTGVPEIDYFFADPVAVPEEERQYYVEKIYDMPCIVTYRPPTEYQIKPTSTLPFYKNEYITFGSFSRFEKISDECLEMFRKILLGVPGSKLMLKDHAFKRPYSIRRVLKAMEGIEPGRIIFAGSTSHPEHMLTYQTVDLILDPWPHGGGVVSMETLYCGVPLITRYGTQPAGRTASSVLTVIGRTDWIAKSADEYIAKAVEWAGRPQDLAKARKTLRDELVNSPVVKGYPEAVEAAYRKLWKEYCKS